MMSLQESGTLMNGGYIILRPQIFDNLFEGEELVVEGFERLVAAEPPLRPLARRLLDADGHLQGEAGARRHGPARRHALAGLEGAQAVCSSLKWPDLGSILCLGAHSDDIEIGAGATVLRLVRENPRARIVWVVLAASGRRGEEARASRGALPGGAGAAEVLLQEFRDGHFPVQWAEIKAFFETLKPYAPDLVLTHYGQDLHQDHRVVSELDLEHLPRPADPRVRDPEVGRRARLAQPLRAGERRRRRRQDRGADAVLPEPGRQALVRRPDLPRPDAPPRPRMLPPPRAWPRPSTPARCSLA